MAEFHAGSGPCTHPVAWAEIRGTQNPKHVSQGTFRVMVDTGLSISSFWGQNRFFKYIH